MNIDGFRDKRSTALGTFTERETETVMTIEMSGINDEKKRKKKHPLFVAIPFLDALAISFVGSKRGEIRTPMLPVLFFLPSPSNHHQTYLHTHLIGGTFFHST